MATLIDTYLTGSLNMISSTNTSGEKSQSSILIDNTNIFDLIYPVGCYYWSSNSTDPADLFGGEWEQIKDKFVLAIGDTFSTVDATGGRTDAIIPSHNHGASLTSAGAHTHTPTSSSWFYVGEDAVTRRSIKPGTNTAVTGVMTVDSTVSREKNTKSAGSHTHSITVDSTGISDISTANMPPYITAYCWRKIKTIAEVTAATTTE